MFGRLREPMCVIVLVVLAVLGAGGAGLGGEDINTQQNAPTTEERLLALEKRVAAIENDFIGRDEIATAFDGVITLSDAYDDDLERLNKRLQRIERYVKANHPVFSEALKRINKIDHWLADNSPQMQITGSYHVSDVDTMAWSNYFNTVNQIQTNAVIQQQHHNDMQMMRQQIYQIKQDNEYNRLLRR